jgi:hypothetical protein
MIVIASVEHLAIALWNDAEESFAREDATRTGGKRTYATRSWTAAHDLDRMEYRERARRVIEDCKGQAKAELRNGR